jgi:YebC/PmpR family DNA-binding regulatory protein
MAGHSKWANIKHRKANADKQRGKAFTKFIKEITVAARSGGGDIANNPRLRLAVEVARSGNMTKDTIERAIKRGAGGEEGQDLEHIIYEGYGVGGVAVMVECLTNNRNRTVSEVRHAFSKCGGNLGTDGSVAYLFSKRGVLNFAPGTSEDKIMELALEAGAEDVVTNADRSIDVFTTQETFGMIKDHLEKQNLHIANAEVTMIAATQIDLDQENAESVLKLLEMLDDLDDVQNVYSNAEFPDDMAE